MGPASKRNRYQPNTPDIPTGSSIGERLLLGLSLVVAGFALFQVVLFRYGRDQGIYAVVADAVLRGGMPYRDAWDFKPPGIYLVYVLSRALFGANQWGIRVLEVLGLLSLLPAFGILSRRFFADVRPGLLGAAMAILVHAQLEFWHTAQPEFFGGVLTIWALVLLIASGRAQLLPAWIAWLGSGFLLGVAGLMKPHLAWGGLVAAAFAVKETRRRGSPLSTQIGAVMLMALGMALPTGLCILWFGIRGALGDMVEALFRFAPRYASLTFQPGMLLSSWYYALQVLLLGLSSVLALGFALCLILPQRSQGEREGLTVIAALMTLHLIGIAIQSKFIPYHFSATIPLLALGAGLGAWKGWFWAKRHRAFGVALFLLAAVLSLIAWTPTQGQLGSFWVRSYQRVASLLSGDDASREALVGQLNTMPAVFYGADYDANVQVARWLEDNSDPGDRVYIWGFEPFIYDVSGRKSASRYIYNVPQRVEWDQYVARQNLMAELLGVSPRVIVVEHGDVFPLVTGNQLDSAGSLEGFPELRRLIAERYNLQGRIANFDLYLRKP